MILDLTPSELMALRDIVAHYLTIPYHSEVFIDCTQQPAVETTPEQLLLRLMGIAERSAYGILARPLPAADVVAAAKAQVAEGAGHECYEWIDITDGRCALCGRRRELEPHDPS